MNKIFSFILALLLPSLVNAQAVIFPQVQQAGTAVSSVSDGTYTLANDLLTATFIHADGRLSFGGCDALGLNAADDLFSIRLANGTEVPSSAMTLNDVALTDLTADLTAAKASLRLPGKAVEASFTYDHLKLTWRALLRDGSHYLRTELSLTAVADVAMNAVVPMLYTIDNSSSNQAPVVVGNTRGAVIASDHIFAGLETPMGKNSIVGIIAAEPFAYSAWTGNSFSWIPGTDTPQGILNLGFTPDYITGIQGYLGIKDSGRHTVTFRYTSGSHRLDLAGVDVLDPFTGAVVASDYHKGTTGGSSSHNVYTLDIPQRGYYLVRYFRDRTEEITGAIQSSFNSNGTITWSGAVTAPEILFDGDLEKNRLSDDDEVPTLTYPVLAVGETRTDAWTPASWSVPDEVPSRIIELGYTADKIQMMEKTVSFAQAGGTLQAEFLYGSGYHGITIAGVELVDDDAHVVASDYHKGFSGSAKTDHCYRFTVPAAGNYRLRYYVVMNPNGSDNTSSGNIHLSYTLHDYLHLAAPTETPIRGEWSRQTTLRSGQTWTVGAVVGLIAPGQARRSFLCYSERERAVPWRPFPVYNSWYELNIDRNNDPNYTGNFNEAQCLEVLNQWKTHLFDRHGVGIGSFVWDDGWDEYGTWSFNPNFPNGFATLSAVAESMDSYIGAWLGPVGGYGQSGNYRRSYWNGKGGMQLSNKAYFDTFLNACSRMVTDYHFNFFKFDGISAQFSAVGPDAGATGEENAEGIIEVERRVRQVKPDVFLNTTVGTWASPFWFQFTDAVWRQENDWGTIGNQGNSREQWITYRDHLVYKNFVQNSPLCPINTLMTHGFMLSNYGGGVANMSRNYSDIVREMRCAFACGSGMVEVYADYALMNSINSGKLWEDLADCIRWQRQNADVLPDVHWVGGHPWDGSKANVYGWAAWNGEKATLALRNPAASAQTFTTTLRQALDIPDYIHTSITLTKAFSQSPLKGLATDTPIDIDTPLTLSLAASSLYIYNGVDDMATVLSAPVEQQGGAEAWYTLDGRRISGKPLRRGIYIHSTSGSQAGFSSFQKTVIR